MVVQKVTMSRSASLVLYELLRYREHCVFANFVERFVELNRILVVFSAIQIVHLVAAYVKGALVLIVFAQWAAIRAGV